MKKLYIRLTVLLFMAMLTCPSAQAETTGPTPTDKTNLIKNPSFETNGTAGWTVKNMSTQSNSVFSVKNGLTTLKLGSTSDKKSQMQLSHKH